ncbi:MAG: hypothetical protein IKL90_01835 [Alphaproteobacteria bacterium]|nr:hypothetical protein [Alphaproteobacteria bacterium]
MLAFFLRKEYNLSKCRVFARFLVADRGTCPLWDMKMPLYLILLLTKL